MKNLQSTKAGTIPKSNAERGKCIKLLNKVKFTIFRIFVFVDTSYTKHSPRAFRWRSTYRLRSGVVESISFGYPPATTISMQTLTSAQISALSSQVVGTGDTDLLCANADGRIRHANTSACTKLGYSLADMLEKSIADYTPTYSLSSWNHHWRQAIENGSHTMYSYHENCSGNRYPVLIHSIPHTIEDTQEQLICSLVQEVQRSKRYKGMLETVEQAYRVGSFDLQFKDQSLVVSDNLLAIMGVSDPETLHPRVISERFAKENAERWEEEMRNFLVGYHRMDDTFVVRTAADQESLVRVSVWSLMSEGEVSGIRGQFKVINGSEKDQMVSLAENQRRHIIRALRYTNGRVTGPNGACKLLEINGKTLFARMKKLDIRREDYRVK